MRDSHVLITYISAMSFLFLNSVLSLSDTSSSFSSLIFFKHSCTWSSTDGTCITIHVYVYMIDKELAVCLRNSSCTKYHLFGKPLIESGNIGLSWSPYIYGTKCCHPECNFDGEVVENNSSCTKNIDLLLWK